MLGKLGAGWAGPCVCALSWQGQDPAESCLAFEGLIALEEKGLG